MLLEDFLSFIKIDTQSDGESELTPSTSKQLVLLNLLKDRLNELGLNASIDEFGRVYGYLDGNDKYDCIGLCAHVDTASEASGKDVKAQIIKNYDGKDIPLGKSGLVLSKDEFPKLKECLGKTIITADGTTLLGSDDKAGVAIILEVIRNLLKIEVNKRHPLAVLFTPDEEIGRGAEHFNLKKFKAKYAYTIDGGDSKYIEFETFNARSAELRITGKSIHPGSGKGKLISALMILHEFILLLPQDEIPFKTEGREGFHHLVHAEGTSAFAKASFILRNHDSKILDRQVEDFELAKRALEAKYPEAKIELIIKDQYRNMKEIILKNKIVLETVENAYKRLGLDYEYEPIRGGTDGATFSFLGCPCPNLGTGGYNFHGLYEFNVYEEMELMSKIVTEIFKI